MKSQFFRASSILGALLILVTLSSAGIAQKRTTQQRQPLESQETVQQRQPLESQEPQLSELRVQELTSETLRIAVPRECAGIRPVVQTHTAVSLSPALASYLNGKPVKGYNNTAVNTFFGDSFKLQSCRVCYATIAVNVQHYGDVWNNDSLTVGVAPFSGSGIVFASGAIWSPATPNPKTITWALNPGLLNAYLMSGSLPPKTLDMVVQDDSTVSTQPRFLFGTTDPAQ